MQILGTIASSNKGLYYAAMDSISTTTISVATPTVTFSNVPQTYRSLQFRIMTKLDIANGTGYIQFNNDTTLTNYAYELVDAVPGITFGATQAADFPALNLAGTNSNASVFNVYTLDIFDYTYDTKRTPNTFLRGGIDRAVRTPGGVYYRTSSGAYGGNKSGGTTTIKFQTASGNFVVGSTFALYGIN